MRTALLSVFFLLSGFMGFCQSKDAAAAARRDSLRMEKMLKNAIYPLIKSAKMGGVMPIAHPEEAIDPNMKYRLLMNFTQAAITPGKAKEINGALAEVARIINLHIAAGVPKENLEVVVIGHAAGLFSLLDQKHYRKKFNMNNPNEPLVKELENAGVTFFGCGQAMQFLDIEKGDLMEGIKQAYSAKTVISTYSLKGFVLMDVNE